MTIKRRLFLSNILMLVMPMLLTALMFTCVIFILLGITGVRDLRSFQDEDVFYSAINKAEELTEKPDYADLQGIQSDIDKFNKTYKEYGITLAIYENDTLLYPSSADTSPMVQIALSEDDNFIIAEGSNAVYSIHADPYTFILSSTSFSLYTENPFKDYRSNYLYVGILMFVLAIAIIFIINRVLTNFVSKRITAPIEILVSGVHELRDGNLDYRIQYDYNDEFKSVCADFNEMAQRLSDMVTARQKDEESRKELIAGISHDLRTPLTSIKAYIEGIEKGLASTPEIQKRYIDTIKSKTDDLEQIINQLFLFTKLDIGEFPLRLEQVEMGEVLRNFTRTAASEYENKGLRISLTENPDGLYADLDILQFCNVLHNILGNSMKYKSGDLVQSEITCFGHDNAIVISITDDGPGVPKDSMDKLFDIFYRSDVSRKDPSSGSGLGLAIAKKTIERFGGTIHAESAASGGLKIIMTLPKSGERA